MDPPGSAGTPHQAPNPASGFSTAQRSQLQSQQQQQQQQQSQQQQQQQVETQHSQQIAHQASQSHQQHQVHQFRDEPDLRGHRHFHHVPAPSQHPAPHPTENVHPIHSAHHPQQLLVSQPNVVTPHASNVVPAASSVTPTAPTLWQYFKRGDKMQKTNKFEANCIFCLDRQGMLTKVRGEKRMMSGHLRNCANASPAAKSEGEAVAIDLKNRRTSANRGRGIPSPGVNAPMRKKSKGRVPLHAGPMVAVAMSAGAGGSSGGENASYFKQDHSNPGFLTNDGIRIYYEERGSGHPLILIHGWSGTSKYFVRNFESLSNSFRVIQFDLRGHGESDKPQWGFHVHRLAADLNNLMDHLQLPNVAVLGCSLGCAVIWAYVELYGVNRISAAMFVDQSPWQMVAPDGSWQYGSSGAFSESAIACLSAKLIDNPRRCHEKNVQMCLNREPTGHETEFFVTESLKAQPWFLAKLMANHSNIDWRSVLRLVTCPALVIVGKRSKVFPWQGVAHAADKMPNARLITFEEGSHWLYYEEADRFNAVVTTFLQKLHS